LARLFDSVTVRPTPVSIYAFGKRESLDLLSLFSVCKKCNVRFADALGVQMWSFRVLRGGIGYLWYPNDSNTARTSCHVGNGRR
jgi:hypothetical protein